MSSDLKTRFEAAGVAVKALSSRPSDDDMLELYALFKQASSGDVSGSRPGLLDFVGGAKFDAWGKLAGTSQDEAMEKYIAKVDALSST